MDAGTKPCETAALRGNRYDRTALTQMEVVCLLEKLGNHYTTFRENPYACTFPRSHLD